MIVKGNHPLVEILARKLSGIEGVPPEYQRKMVSTAIKEAIKYHEEQLKDYKECRSCQGTPCNNAECRLFSLGGE